MEWLTDLTAWFASIFQQILDIFAEMLKWLSAWFLELITDFVVTGLDFLSIPSAWSSYGFAQLGLSVPGIAYYLDRLRVYECVGILVTATMIKVLRKIVTLFQW